MRGYDMTTHETLCRQATQALAEVDLQAVTAAFVASLSARDLPARSAFGSYVVLQHFALHDFVPFPSFAAENCAYCGFPRQTTNVETDQRVQCYPFQVQHTNLQYAAYDLATFKNRRVGIPSSEDRKRLQALFQAIGALPATAQLPELRKSLQGIIQSNKYERMILLETLGYAGILCPQDQQNYSASFVAYDFANRTQPPQFSKREWAYPVRFWTGADGMNENWLQHYFRSFL
jgi:hypothetical protein